LGVKYSFFHNQITILQEIIGLGDLPSLLKDLVTIRIFEPASKLRSLELMERYFGIHHTRKTYYKMAPGWIEFKDEVERVVMSFAKKCYSFNYELLFYDVTTLYFETFGEDELRKNGFSKDNKSQQPQILVALMVTREGFPIAYEIFSGNTFEGYTIIPVVKGFIERNQVKEFTVVADAAMISADNIRELTKNNINYIVGARLGNISAELLEITDKNICREDGKSIRFKTELGYLICSYSSALYRKELHEMNNQIEKARKVVDQPSKTKKLKFIQTKNQKVMLNEKLIDKTNKILGIKGDYTNLEETMVDNKTIIERYHELYNVSSG
jgi:transposase